MPVDQEYFTHCNDYPTDTGGFSDDIEGLLEVNEEEHSSSGEFIDTLPGSAEVYEGGHTFLSLFDEDENSVHQVNNPYYLFSGWKDWEVGSWLLHSGLSMGKIDSFLLLEMIKALPLLFCSVIKTSHPTKSPVILYWCNPVECITSILKDPSFQDHFHFMPHNIYTTVEWKCCIYSEWMTSDDAWNMQSMLPNGSMLLGTILSSDKTNISALTGDRVAHPLLISLANIFMKTCAKMSSSSFLLTAILPVPKFIHKNRCMRGVLEDHLIHQCLLEPLKQAARVGVTMPDPAGNNRHCYTGLASYIADTPEAMMLSTVGGKMLPLTMAMFKQFGDPFRHEPHTKSLTLTQLKVVCLWADPLNLEVFFHEAQKFWLNGVIKPFWSNWILAKPLHFFTPEMLHHFHWEFYDHDVKWLINAVSELEIDFHFSVLPHVTGQCHCDIQCSIIAVSADAAPRTVLTAIRTLMDFWYLIHASCIDNNDLKCISSALAEFHAKKDAIITAGIRCREGKNIITNWHIPKIELMQSIVPSICNTGVPMHNNNNYDPQICCYLDCEEKCRRFNLATGLLNPYKVKLAPGGFDEGDDEDEGDEDDIPADLLFTIPVPGCSWPITNYFVVAQHLCHKDVSSIPLPLCIFTVGWTAFHLAYSPSIRTITINEVAVKFGLPDLHAALTDFLYREATHGQHHV
ncbi:hypothetical protein BDR03DRAFT_1014179 [Suillus americanus]|nr:hypothetical protein BDR03DRAFT_1014179 [Suillus americanus]